YEAFGQLLSSTGNTDNTYRFTGEQYDAGLDQYYLRARYYSQNSGRFTQMDTWNGSMNDPIALHKYLYANANPTMYVDPTGKFASLGEFGVAFTVLGLGVTAAYQQGPAFGSAFNTGLSMPEFQHGAGQSALWNVLALVQFNAKIHSSANAEAATVSETDVKEHGHHTIPVYLCGGVKQETSRVMQKDHVLIHSEMATIRLAIKSAHEYAYRTIGRKRSSDVLHLARSEMGREAISAALENFYKSFSWWRVGVAPIGDVFTRERLGFVSGRNTSLPWCTRGKGS
ncbi:MAG: RHS repeat-associated core domain-containing protein, partial [Gammaproteobacteria bacterium]|nr:RHS repeat-associated core domain-containing protein [Gammaproteobacteria bacterium]